MAAAAAALREMFIALQPAEPIAHNNADR